MLAVCDWSVDEKKFAYSTCWCEQEDELEVKARVKVMLMRIFFSVLEGIELGLLYSMR